MEKVKYIEFNKSQQYQPILYMLDKIEEAYNCQLPSGFKAFYLTYGTEFIFKSKCFKHEKLGLLYLEINSLSDIYKGPFRGESYFCSERICFEINSGEYKETSRMYPPDDFIVISSFVVLSLKDFSIYYREDSLACYKIFNSWDELISTIEYDEDELRWIK